MSEDRRQYVLYDGLLERIKTTPYWKPIKEFLAKTTLEDLDGFRKCNDEHIKEFTNGKGALLADLQNTASWVVPKNSVSEPVKTLWQRLLDGTSRPWETYTPIPETHSAVVLDRVLLSGYIASLAIPLELIGGFSNHFKTFSEFAGTIGAILLTSEHSLSISKELQYPVRDPERNEVQYRPDW